MTTLAAAENSLVSPILRRPWRWMEPASWLLGLSLALLFAAVRAAGIFGGRAWQPLLPLGFTCMAILPWLLLSRQGRREIGWRLPTNGRAYGSACLVGVGAALACFLLGCALFGRSGQNWFVSIAGYYRHSLDTSGFGLWRLHLTFTLPAMLFSPFGEEIFFRGVLQRLLEQRFSQRSSTFAEAGFFGVVHLCHHGIAPGPSLLLPSAPLWALLMTVTAWLFARLRKSSGSLAPAILAHASFNLTMNVCIFAALWT